MERDGGCGGCSRRAAMKGVGLVVLSTVLPGCRRSGSLPQGAAARCTGGICLDLAAPANAPLAQVGGGVLIDSGSDTIAVIRTSDTQVVALSAICTHEGCIVELDAGARILQCPCHGAQYDETGAVLAGPARRPLTHYAATLAGSVITVVA